MVRTLRPLRTNTVDLYKEMDNLVHHLFGDSTKHGGSSKSNSCYTPKLNLVETDKDYQVSLDLPGVKSDDITVELEEDRLTISGKRSQEEKSEGKTYHRIERSYGEFSRVITLPELLDEGKVSADYTDGVLTVLLPKSEKAKPTKITVNTVSKN